MRLPVPGAGAGAGGREAVGVAGGAPGAGRESVGAGYDVRIEPGLLSRLGSLCAESAPAHRYAIVADNRVAELYGGRALASFRKAGLSADLFPFPAGEWNKTRQTWMAITDRILHAGMGRDGAVVALGGGVTGDLAGFVAATFMRGVPVVQVPSTLLAMVDGSVGGKVGVDTEAGKNLVGAFHQPALVVVDPELLDTLPPVHRSAGLAEVVKMAAIRDGSFFEWLEERADALAAGEPEALAVAIERSVRHKAEVIGDDPLEAGPRATLNFGHTVGHALELLTGYEALHGEAVAAGMRAETRLGERLEITEPGTARRLETLLDGCGLERRLEEERSARALWEAAARDKKARGGLVRCIFLRSVGEVARTPEGEWSFPVPADEGEDWFRTALDPALLGDAQT